nr:oligoendopeptidase F [Lachnospiraceae bacterium]
DLFITTLITQCKYSEFEDYCYKILESGGSLNGDDLNRKWLELTRLYDGDNVKIDDDSGIGWARIPHLYNNYYVYQYATSITYAASICNLVDKNGQDEIDDYIRFLKAGTSISPADSLRIANVDTLDDKTYEEAGTLIKKLIDEYIAAAGR